MDILFFDKEEARAHLYPLLLSRPAANLRIGALRLDEKWSQLLLGRPSYLTVNWLASSYGLHPDLKDRALIIFGAVCPDTALVTRVKELELGEILVDVNNRPIAAHTSSSNWVEWGVDAINHLKAVVYPKSITRITYPEDIWLNNFQQFLFDFEHFLRFVSKDESAMQNVRVSGEYEVIVEKGAQVEPCYIDASDGPVFISKRSKIQLGSMIKGGVFIGENARVKMGAQIYPNCCIGPNSVVAGELANVVFWGDSNKGHHGYLGCSVIGQYCNLGAGTTNSNLQNNFKAISVYDYYESDFRFSGQLKCGVVMGDYSMSGINTSFTTGAVIGVGVQYSSSKISPKWVPDFSWVTDQKNEAYNLNKFLETCERRYQMVNGEFPIAEREVIMNIYKRLSNNQNIIDNE